MENDKKKNYIWIIILAVLIVLAVIVFLIFKSKYQDEVQQENVTESVEPETESTQADPEKVFGYDAESDDVARISGDVADMQAPKISEDTTAADVDKKTEYRSPIDFLELTRQNPDIKAWLSVPGTNISYPVCQSSTDDTFYLNHNSEGNLDVNGAIFTESAHNQNDFLDPVTVVYGHNMKSGRMFGYLEETFRDGLEGHDEAIVYLPNGEIHYRLFAALRVPSGHLLEGRNMYKPDIFEQFAKSITGNKDLYSVIDHSIRIEEDDRLIVLSTCVGGDPSQRYIVVGKRISEENRDLNRRMDKTD